MSLFILFKIYFSSIILDINYHEHKNNMDIDYFSSVYILIEKNNSKQMKVMYKCWMSKIRLLFSVYDIGKF